MKRVISVLCCCVLFNNVFSQTIDSLIIKARLASLKSSVVFDYNEEVTKYLVPLLANENNSTADMIYEANKFLPYVENVVKDKKMPHALTYLPYVITHYINEHNPDDGKVGIWYMPYAVARKYDLHPQSLLWIIWLI